MERTRKGIASTNWSILNSDYWIRVFDKISKEMVDGLSFEEFDAFYRRQMESMGLVCDGEPMGEFAFCAPMLDRLLVCDDGLKIEEIDEMLNKEIEVRKRLGGRKEVKEVDEFSIHLVDEGIALEDVGKYEMAVRCHNMALLMDLENAVAWGVRGRTILKLEKIEVEEIEKLHSTDRYEQKVEKLRMCKKWVEMALSSFQRSAELNPGDDDDDDVARKLVNEIQKPLLSELRKLHHQIKKCERNGH